MANNSTCSSICSTGHQVVSPALLSDRDLLDAAERVAGDERRTTADLLALLAELDTRKLYLGEGYSSLFTYCTQRLHLSESAAYGRITAARAARRFPMLLARLAEGDVTLTSICLLAAHLTDDNHEALLDAARHASRRDVERLVASLHTQPDTPASVRRLPGSGDQLQGRALAFDDATAMRTALPSGSDAPEAKNASAAPPAAAARQTAPRPPIAPLAADRYLLRMTIDASTYAKLERARDLLRHAIPSGDLAAIVDRALALLVDQLERRKAGLVDRPSASRARATRLHGRHVPAAVKRAVWSRDRGRCAFIGAHGRCKETGFLEYHHLVPFAMGGATDAANLERRCRAHNAYEATEWFGEKEHPVAHAAAD
jgi:hypothetical protein